MRLYRATVSPVEPSGISDPCSSVSWKDHVEKATSLRETSCVLQASPDFHAGLVAWERGDPQVHGRSSQPLQWVFTAPWPSDAHLQPLCRPSLPPHT